MKLASGVTGWMHYSRIKHYYTKKDLPKGPEDSGEEIDEQTRKQGVNYYEVARPAARGDKKALKTFVTLGLDGAAEETHITSILPVVIHLVGDDALAEFLRNQPLNFQLTVRNKLDENVNILHFEAWNTSNSTFRKAPNYFSGARSISHHPTVITQFTRSFPMNNQPRTRRLRGRN